MTCFPGRTECQQKAFQATNPPRVGSFVPKCNPDGSYARKQCWGSTGQCWCVSEDGTEWPGTKVRGEPNCDDKNGKCSHLCLCKKLIDRALKTNEIIGRVYLYGVLCCIVTKYYELTFFFFFSLFHFLRVSSQSFVSTFTIIFLFFLPNMKRCLFTNCHSFFRKVHVSLTFNYNFSLIKDVLNDFTR